MRTAKYRIGQQYKTAGKNSKVCTIKDIHTTYNAKGEFVKLRYVSEHEFCGQVVTNYDVVETTVSRGLIACEAIEKEIYHTDGIHDFIAFNGFADSVQIIAKSLKISVQEATERLEKAQTESRNEV